MQLSFIRKILFLQKVFVNSINRNYYLIGNQDELMKAIDNGDIKIKGGITWNDDQQKATPQYRRA